MVLKKPNYKVNVMAKKRAKVVNCKHFKSCGNVFGGCKHPKANTACIYQYLDECSMSERKYKLKSRYNQKESIMNVTNLTDLKTTIEWLLENGKFQDTENSHHIAMNGIKLIKQQLAIYNDNKPFKDELFNIAYDYESSVSERMEQIKSLLIKEH